MRFNAYMTWASGAIGATARWRPTAERLGRHPFWREPAALVKPPQPLGTLVGIRPARN